MADYKLNLTPPIEPEPDPLPTALPEASSTSTFEVGSGSEGPVRVEGWRASKDDLHTTSHRIADKASDKLHEAAGEARERLNEVAERASKVADQAKQRLRDSRVASTNVCPSGSNKPAIVPTTLASLPGIPRRRPTRRLAVIPSKPSLPLQEQGS